MAEQGSEFVLQIVNAKGGAVVSWMPGSPVEVNMAEELCNRLSGRAIGLFTSKAAVLDAVKEEFANMLWYLKSRV